MEIKTVKIVEVQEWDDLVQETYQRPYNFQQQDGCKERGLVYISIPAEIADYKNDAIVEVVNGSEMGVSFKAWLERDPEEPMKDEEDPTRWLELFWERNFYPSVNMIINDLHERGLLDAGELAIDIDW